MASTYLTADFVERRISSIPPAGVGESWGVERGGHYYQLDLKMCRISALHFDFQWPNDRTGAPRMAAPLDAPSRILRLDISLNELAVLHPDWLMPFRNLRALDASLNQIKQFQGIEVLQQLRSLNLSHNAIRSINGLSLNRTLVELRLAVNDISDISELPSLTNLKILDISNNKLHSLDGLTSLPRLEELYVHRNELRDILPVMSCNKLRVLNAANNRIAGFDTTLKVLSSLPHLQVLSLHSNPIDREPHYQGEILRTGSTIMTLDNVTVKPLPKREKTIRPESELFSELEDYKRHAGNMFSLKDAARQAFHDRMRVAKDRLDDNVSFLQRRIVALQHEHEEFEGKLKADLEACLRYLDSLTDEELESKDRSNIGAVLSRKPYPEDEGPERDGARHRPSAADYSNVRETDELLRCAYNELIKQGSNADTV
ncbi:uncharacterized protein LOC143295412 isoform X2 [Babylonia areolata]|uniref:uncharacterized protein LOC143295412 isoform X2 n=1 Tax=Babylonia areolata TaxID=304850 RepID=UPI003FD50846